jgi:hypothetical protein
VLEYDSREDMERALDKIEGVELRGNKLRVDAAGEPAPRSNGGRDERSAPRERERSRSPAPRRRDSRERSRSPPRRRDDSPPRRRDDSPPRRRDDSPPRREPVDDLPPPRD